MYIINKANKYLTRKTICILQLSTKTYFAYYLKGERTSKKFFELFASNLCI